jgi:hypothetical protein
MFVILWYGRKRVSTTVLEYILRPTCSDCTSLEGTVGAEIKDLLSQNRHLLKEEIVLVGVVNEASMKTVCQ